MPGPENHVFCRKDCIYYTSLPKCSKILTYTWFYFSSSVLCGVHFGPHICYKTNPKNLIFASISGIVFWGFGALQVPLGSLPEPLMIVLGASKTRKVLFLYWKIILFEIVVFRYLEALDVLLGFILAPLGPILGPIRPPKMVPRSAPKSTKIWSNSCPMLLQFLWGQKSYRQKARRHPGTQDTHKTA